MHDANSKNNLIKYNKFNSTIRVGRLLESDVWLAAKAICVSCSENKCRIRESDLRAACLYLTFEVWYETSFG